MDFFCGAKQHKLERLFRAWRVMPGPLRVATVDILYTAARTGLFFLTGPVRLILYVTGRCTRRCEYCFYARELCESGENDLTLDEISGMARSMPNGLKVVTITGGEPYLREDLPDIAVALHRHAGVPKLSINSNGDLPEAAERAVLKILKTTDACLNLQVSIQASADLDETPGDTLAVLAGIAEKNSRVSQVSAQTTICRSSLDMLPELMGRIRRMPGIFHKLQFLRSPGDCVFAPEGAEISTLTPPNYESESLSDADRARALKIVENSMAGSRYPLMAQRQLVGMRIAAGTMRKRGPLLPCRAGNVDAVVYNRGDVAICEFYKSFASLRDYGMDFRKLWSSEEIAAHRRLAAACACAHPCSIGTSMSYDRTSLHRILLV